MAGMGPMDGMHGTRTNQFLRQYLCINLSMSQLLCIGLSMSLHPCTGPSTYLYTSLSNARYIHPVWRQKFLALLQQHPQVKRVDGQTQHLQSHPTTLIMAKVIATRTSLMRPPGLNKVELAQQSGLELDSL